MQIGTTVILLPLHNPVSVAEEAVTLDIVSGGRAVLGVGLGYQEADFPVRCRRVPLQHPTNITSIMVDDADDNDDDQEVSNEFMLDSCKTGFIEFRPRR